MIWVVGDVHGCVRAFERLVREIRFDPARDALWSAGDLVNTGPRSVEVLRLWRDLGGRAVLGNHDIYALRAFAGSFPRHHDRLDPGPLANLVVVVRAEAQLSLHGPAYRQDRAAVACMRARRNLAGLRGGPMQRAPSQGAHRTLHHLLGPPPPYVTRTPSGR